MQSTLAIPYCQVVHACMYHVLQYTQSEIEHHINIPGTEYSYNSGVVILNTV